MARRKARTKRKRPSGRASGWTPRPARKMLVHLMTATAAADWRRQQHQNLQHRRLHSSQRSSNGRRSRWSLLLRWLLRPALLCDAPQTWTQSWQRCGSQRSFTNLQHRLQRSRADQRCQAVSRKKMAACPKQETEKKILRLRCPPQAAAAVPAYRPHLLKGMAIQKTPWRRPPSTNSWSLPRSLQRQQQLWRPRASVHLERQEGLL